MASSSVYTGRWTDYSLDGWSRDVITLNVRDGAILIAALSTFVGFVGTACWSLIAFWLHQSRTRSDPQDGFYFQQQAVYRNSASPATALNLIRKMLWAWRKPRGRAHRVKHLKTRAFMLAVPPLAIFLGFTIAGIFVASVAGKAYNSNDVLLTSDLCGYWTYNGSSQQVLAASQQKVINDTMAGRAYVSACYDKSASTTTTGPTECGLYPVSTLPYTTQMVACPFGQSPNGTNLCLPDQNTAFQLSTPQLDSNTMFGINAPPEDRVTISKSLTCAPLSTKDYVTFTGVVDSDGTYYWNLGPLYNSAFSYTWSYSPRTASDNIGYQITSAYSRDGAWTPVKALQVAAGDTSIHFMTPNSIRYLTPVDDLFYAAHYLSTSNNTGTLYASDKWVYVMGCIDQFQLCNPTTSPPSCTIQTSFSTLLKAANQLVLTAPQKAAANRLLVALAQTDTYSSTAALGSFSLLARTKVYGNQLSTGLPANQWQLEVEGWFRTTLAKMQQYIMEYVSNSPNLGPYGSVRAPDLGLTNQEEAAAARAMCHSQRVRNTGAYQTFSVVGLLVIICVGGAIIVLNWIVEPVVARLRKWRSKKNNKETARVADRTFQLLKVALGGGNSGSKDLASGDGDGVWEKCLDDVPVTRPGVLFMPAVRITGTNTAVRHDGERGDNYIYPGVSSGGTGEVLEMNHLIPK